MRFESIFTSDQFIIPTISWSSSSVTHTIMSSAGKVKLNNTEHLLCNILIYFWTIAKPSHRDYFELHRMQINIYRTIAEFRTLTTDTKLFTTLWIVQNHTNTALFTEILALSPFEDSGCVCCPLVEGAGFKNWQYCIWHVDKNLWDTLCMRLLKQGVGEEKPTRYTSSRRASTTRVMLDHWDVVWICVGRSVWKES